MDLSLREDQQAVEQLFTTFFENECPPERVRRAEPLGFDADLWDRFAATGASEIQRNNIAERMLGLPRAR